MEIKTKQKLTLMHSQSLKKELEMHKMHKQNWQFNIYKFLTHKDAEELENHLLIHVISKMYT